MASKRASLVFLAAASIFGTASSQYFQRLGTCPTLGCVFPPDQATFIAGAYFDIRLEVHAPRNGSEATGKAPDTGFTFSIQEGNGTAQNATTYLKVSEPALERWNFTWYEGKCKASRVRIFFIIVVLIPAETCSPEPPASLPLSM